MPVLREDRFRMELYTKYGVFCVGQRHDLTIRRCCIDLQPGFGQRQIDDQRVVQSDRQG